MFNKLNNNELMDVNGGAYYRGVPVWNGSKKVGYKTVSSDSNIDCFRWNSLTGSYVPQYKNPIAQPNTSWA